MFLFPKVLYWFFLLPLVFFLSRLYIHQKQRASATFFLSHVEKEGRSAPRFLLEWRALLRAITLASLILFYAAPYRAQHPFRHFVILFDNRPPVYKPVKYSLLKPFLRQLPPGMEGEIYPLCGQPQYGTAKALLDSLPPSCKAFFPIELKASTFQRHRKRDSMIFIFSPDPLFAVPSWQALGVVQASPLEELVSLSLEKVPPFIASGRAIPLLLRPFGFLPTSSKLKASIQIGSTHLKQFPLKKERLVWLPSQQPSTKRMTILFSGKRFDKVIQKKVMVQKSIPIFLTKGAREILPFYYALLPTGSFPLQPAWVSSLKRSKQGIYVATTPEEAKAIRGRQRKIIFLSPAFSSADWTESLRTYPFTIEIKPYQAIPSSFFVVPESLYAPFLHKISLADAKFRGHFSIATDASVYLKHLETGQPALLGDSKTLLINFSIYEGSNFYKTKEFVLLFRELLERFAFSDLHPSSDIALSKISKKALSDKEFLAAYTFAPLQPLWLALFLFGLSLELLLLRRKA